MKAEKLIKAIEELVRLADKETYYRENNLHLRFPVDDSSYVIGTREDGSVHMSIYYGQEMGFKFFMEKDGTLLLDEGSTAMLIEYSGPDHVLGVIENASDNLLMLGKAKIELGEYEFRTMQEVNEEFRKIMKGNQVDKDKKH